MPIDLGDWIEGAAGAARAYMLWGAIAAKSRLSARRRADGGRELLLFSWWMPPEISPGVHRPLSQVRFAATHDWKINVFAGPAPAKPSAAGLEMAARLPNDLGLHRLSEDPVRRSWRLSPRIHANAFIEGLRLADAAMTNRDLNPSVVVASGPPFSTFIAGYYAARYYKVPLVLDYRDVWSQCAFGWYSSTHGDQVWDKRIFTAADAATFTTESQLKKTVAATRHTPPICTVVENGWDEGDFATAAAAPTRSPTDALTISFVGHLLGHTALVPFLDLAARILARRPDLAARLEFQFVGSADGDMEQRLAHHPLASKIRRKQHVPKREALSLMQTSAALLIVGDPQLSIYIPGKLYDYLAARRPVLFYGAEGEVTRILREIHAGWTVAADAERDLEAAFDNILSSGSPPLSSPEFDAWLNVRSRGVLAQKFFSILDQVTGRAASRSS